MVSIAGGSPSITFADVDVCKVDDRLSRKSVHMSQAYVSTDTNRLAITACTMMMCTQAHLLPQWIAYHRSIGIEQFYVYLITKWYGYKGECEHPFFSRGKRRWDASETDETGAPEQLGCDLGPDVHLIRWPFQEFGFKHQQSLENSCLRRQEGISKWVLISDVDEYVQVGLLYATCILIYMINIFVPNLGC